MAIPPAGTSPASAWSPPPGMGAPAPPALLADDIDPSTGELRAIATAPHPVDAAIREAFRIRAGSGAALGLAGHRFAELRERGPRIDRQIRDEVMRIMAPFVERGDARIDAILVDTATASQGADGAAAFVRYLNCHTAQSQEI